MVNGLWLLALVVLGATAALAQEQDRQPSTAGAGMGQTGRRPAGSAAASGSGAARGPRSSVEERIQCHEAFQSAALRCLPPASGVLGPACCPSIQALGSHCPKFSGDMARSEWVAAYLTARTRLGDEEPVTK